MLNNFRVLILPTIISASLVITGCGGGSDDGATGTTQLTATVSGIVTSSGGLPVSGVTITAGSSTTTSKADGRYTLAVAPSAALKVDAKKAGFVTTFDMIPLAAG